MTSDNMRTYGRIVAMICESPRKPLVYDHVGLYVGAASPPHDEGDHFTCH